MAATPVSVASRGVSILELPFGRLSRKHIALCFMQFPLAIRVPSALPRAAPAPTGTKDFRWSLACRCIGPDCRRPAAPVLKVAGCPPTTLFVSPAAAILAQNPPPPSGASAATVFYVTLLFIFLTAIV